MRSHFRLCYTNIVAKRTLAPEIRTHDEKKTKHVNETHVKTCNTTDENSDLKKR